MEIQSIQRTNIDYLGTQISQERKEYLDELNSKFDIKVEPQQEYMKEENIKIENSEDKQREPLKTVEDNAKLNQIMTHNVITNIPTQDFLRIKGS